MCIRDSLRRAAAPPVHLLPAGRRELYRRAGRRAQRRTERLLRLNHHQTKKPVSYTHLDEMMKVRNLGRKSLEEVMAKLDSLGFSLTKDDEN